MAATTYTPNDTHLLATYRTARSEQRMLLAEPHAVDTSGFRVLDTLEFPAGERADAREVEPYVPTLSEAQAIAEDYRAKATKLGWPLMPTPWW